MTEEEEEEDEEEDEEDEEGSRVVARCSFSGSTSMESRRTWAVLRGCRSFCTATHTHKEDSEFFFSNFSLKIERSFQRRVFEFLR